MIDNFFCFSPWVGLVCSIVGIVYIGISIRYTEKNPLTLSAIKNTRFAKVLDSLFFNENQIVPLKLVAMHAEWQNPFHLASDNEQKMIQQLAKETIRKHGKLVKNA
ncbi:MAG: hypothetical protein Q7U36_03830 [bacterium]|nr:hypothetical protein [bacterium]